MCACANQQQRWISQQVRFQHQWLIFTVTAVDGEPLPKDNALPGTITSKLVPGLYTQSNRVLMCCLIDNQSSAAKMLESSSATIEIVIYIVPSSWIYTTGPTFADCRYNFMLFLVRCETMRR